MKVCPALGIRVCQFIDQLGPYLGKPHTNGMITLRITVLITIYTNYVYKWRLGFSWMPVSFSSSCWATTGGAIL
jgi:hypothetical protein